MKKIYIVGAGGFGREIVWLIERINEETPTWDIAGFIDDDVSIHGKAENGYWVLGGCEYFSKIKEEVWVVCSIGCANVRKQVIQKLQKYENINYATLIDPSVIKSKRVIIGEGSIVCAGSIITVNVSIGNHVIVNLDCTIGHDANICDYVTLYPSVNISGNVMIEENVELGTGTQIIQGKRIGKGTIVGAGAVIVTDLPPKCTAVGCPAKPIKFYE